MRDHLREKRSKITTTTTKTCKKTKVDLKFALFGGLCKKNNINFNERLRKKGIKGVEKMDHMYGQVCSCFGFIYTCKYPWRMQQNGGFKSDFCYSWRRIFRIFVYFLSKNRVFMLQEPPLGPEIRKKTIFWDSELNFC